MMKSFETETYNISLRNDLNLIFTLSQLIKTLTKIDTQDSQDIAIMSAYAINKTASELLNHVRSMYQAKDADKAAQTNEAEAACQ